MPFDAQEALRLVQDRRAMFKQKQPYLWQWFLNLNFFVGNQWLTWDPTLRSIIQPAQDPDKPRVTENKILPTVRQAVGKVLRQQLKQIAPPSAQGEDEVDKAKVRTQLLGHLRRVCGTDDMLKNGLIWAANTGSFFSRYMWDEDTGPRNKSGNPQGDISVVPVSPFAIVVPDNCLTIEELPWIMEVTTKPVEWVKDHYGVEVDADGAASSFEQFGARVLDFTSSGVYVSSQSDVDTKGKDGKLVAGGPCTFIMYWERPCATYENGRLIIVAGGKVVHPQNDAEAEEGIKGHSPSGDLPYNRLTWFDTGFRFWELGLVESLVPLQRERNMYASMIQDALKHVARAGWIAPKGSVKKDEWSAESGAINEYTPVGGGKPEPMSPRAISPEFFQRISMIDQDMADIAGLHYRPAPGMRAAAAFALQQETDNAMAEPVVANVEKFLIRDGQLKLRLAKKHYGKGRTIRVAGEGLRWEVMEYDGDKLGDSDEVEVQGSGQLAQDKTQRLDQVLKLLAAKDAKGEPVIDAYEARRLLDLENSENIDSQVKADVNRARYENSMLDKGESVVVNQWDNHDIHLREHYTRMKRLDFDELPVNVREAFIQHTTAHEQGKALAMAPQQPQGQQQGLPPGMQGPGQMPQGMPPQAAQVAQQLMPEAASNPISAGMQSGMTHVANVVAQAQQ